MHIRFKHRLEVVLTSDENHGHSHLIEKSGKFLDVCIFIALGYRQREVLNSC